MFSFRCPCCNLVGSAATLTLDAIFFLVRCNFYRWDAVPACTHAIKQRNEFAAAGGAAKPSFASNVTAFDVRYIYIYISIKSKRPNNFSTHNSLPFVQIDFTLASLAKHRSWSTFRMQIYWYFVVLLAAPKPNSFIVRKQNNWLMCISRTIYCFGRHLQKKYPSN